MLWDFTGIFGRVIFDRLELDNHHYEHFKRSNHQYSLFLQLRERNDNGLCADALESSRCNRHNRPTSDVLCGRCHRSGCGDLPAHLPDAVQATRRHAAESCKSTFATPRTCFTSRLWLIAHTIWRRPKYSTIVRISGSFHASRLDRMALTAVTPPGWLHLLPGGYRPEDRRSDSGPAGGRAIGLTDGGRVDPRGFRYRSGRRSVSLRLCHVGFEGVDARNKSGQTVCG